MTTENRVTSEQAGELARWVGEMLPPKCSSVIHPACNRPAEYYVETMHDCQQLPVKVWPVCAVVVQSLGQNVVDGRSFCPHCNTSMHPTSYRMVRGHVPHTLTEDA